LQNGVAYTTFLNGLLPGKFKLFLIKSKVTTLADVEEDNDSQSNKLPRKDYERVGRFHTNARSILIEIKRNPMLKRPKPIETSTKFKNKNKHYEYHEDFGLTTSECRELKNGHHKLADWGQ